MKKKQFGMMVAGMASLNLDEMDSADVNDISKTGASNNKKKNTITLKDKIVLGPIDRYKKYNHFPWKFIMHLILIAITSMQVLTIVSVETDYAFNSQLSYSRLFMTTPWNEETASAGQTITIYNIDALRDFVQQVVDNYEAIDSDNSFEKITLGDPQEMVLSQLDGT